MLDQIKLRLGWRRTCALLRNASEFLAPFSAIPEVDRALAEYREFLDHNELECAMNMLEHAGDHVGMGSEFWEKLANAAESMELTQEGKEMRSRASATLKTEN